MEVAKEIAGDQIGSLASQQIGVGICRCIDIGDVAHLFLAKAGHHQHLLRRAAVAIVSEVAKDGGKGEAGIVQPPFERRVDGVELR